MTYIEAMIEDVCAVRNPLERRAGLAELLTAIDRESLRRELLRLEPETLRERLTRLATERSKTA